MKLAHLASLISNLGPPDNHAIIMSQHNYMLRATDIHFIGRILQVLQSFQLALTLPDHLPTSRVL